MRVSVAMCTFNGAAYLKQQLESISAQARLPDELVIFDDGSTDATEDIIASFKQGASFDVVFTKQSRQQGINNNFSQCIEACSGDVIFIADQDDFWQPQKIMLAMYEFEKDPNLSMVVSDSLLVDQKLVSLTKTIWGNERFSASKLAGQADKFPSLLNHSPFSGHSMGFSGRLKPLISPIPKTWFYDQWISKLAAASGSVALLDECLVLYRQHSSQTMGSNNASLANKVTQEPIVPIGYFEAEALKYQALKIRIESANAELLDDKQKVVDLLGKKVSFMRTRDSLREASVVVRYGKVIVNIVNLNYFKFARGLLSAARDLVG